MSYKHQPLWYLASPISHPDRNVVMERLESVFAFQYALLDAGIMSYCPHIHWHEIVDRYNPPSGWDYWEKPSLTFVDRCTGVIVYCLPGHARSVGVKAEVEFAKARGMPIYFVQPQLEVFTIEEIKQKHY